MRAARLPVNDRTDLRYRDQPVDLVRWAWRRALARLPHNAIEHHRRRPVGLVNSQPQSWLG